MLFLTAVVMAGLFSWLCSDIIRKKPIPFYIAGTVISVLMIILNQAHIQFSPFVEKYIISLFSKGIFAAALWCIVAWTGAIPDEAKSLRKKLLPSRGELSVFSALITLSHAVVYGISYCRRIFSGTELTSDFIMNFGVCLLLMLIMIPLTVLSFKAIRKKMNAKLWKRIQRTAYVFYGLIYLHIMVILIPRSQQGREGVLINILIYTIVFLSYAVFRIRKALIKQKKIENKAVLNSVCTAVIILSTSVIGISSKTIEHPAVTAEKSVSVQETAISEKIPVSESESISETETKIVHETESETELTTELISEIVSETEIKVSETTISETQALVESTVTAETEIPETNAPQEVQIPEETKINEEISVQEEQIPKEETAPEREPEPEIQTEPETETVSSIYQDGVYTAVKFGYDSDVVITVTIQNDVITDISASCNESDMYYFDTAYPVLRDAVLSAQSPDVDAVSGATYSSNAIRDGVRDALNQARR